MLKKQINKLDKLWGEIIHSLNDKCAVCGKTGRLEAHHIFTRSRRATRWFIDNGILLCANCHKFSPILSAHKAPRAFFSWLENKMGKPWVNLLDKKSQEIFKGDFEGVLKYLNEYEKTKMD